MDRSNHVCDRETGKPHACIENWRKLHAVLDHVKLGRQAKSGTMERRVFSELRAGPSALLELGMSCKQITDIVRHLRQSGLEIGSQWSFDAVSKFGLRVKHRVYWLGGSS